MYSARAVTVRPSVHPAPATRVAFHVLVQSSGSGTSGRSVTGEPVSVYVHPVELTVGDRSFMVPVVFVPAPNPFGLAGQRGFFDELKVTFNFREEELELAKPSSNAQV